MTSAAEAREFRRNMGSVVKLARRDLSHFWAKLDHADAFAVKASMETFYPKLVQAYGNAAASIAADYYDDLRDASPARGSFRAVVGKVTPMEKAKATARWGIGPLFGKDANPAEALALLSGAAQRLVQEPSRDTIAESSRRDPAKPRYARVPSGADTCAFCLMVSSRGAVYWSEAAAGGMGHEYHDGCWCEPEPVWEGQAPSYDDASLYNKYLGARDENFFDTKGILAKMREQHELR